MKLVLAAKSLALKAISRTMKLLLLPLTATLAFPTAVNAGVDPEVHRICLKAADYAGCVKVQTEGIAAPAAMTIWAKGFETAT